MTADYLKFIEILNNAKVEYVVIGGVAMVAQGAAHAIFDIDICYRRLPKIWNVFAGRFSRGIRSFAARLTMWPFSWT